MNKLSIGLYLHLDESKSHCFGLFSQLAFPTLLLLLLSHGKDRFIVGLPGGDEVEKDASEFMGGGGDGLGSSQTSAQATVESAEIRVAAM
jgi:hypothetical protein